MRVRLDFAALIVVVVLTGASRPELEAKAGGPIIFRDPLNDQFTTGACGFPMEVRTTGTGVFHLFLDDGGEFERIIITSAGIRITFTNLLTGESVWTPSVNMVRDVANDDGSGTQSLRGLLWHLVVPGEGLVTADVGRIDFRVTFDEDGHVIGQQVVFLAGQQENQFFPKLCSVLGS